MSKITPKNLSYDNTLPPFLARLQSQNATNDGRQDYHAARPKKPRDAQLDAEDEPVYFDEKSGETLTKGEWEEREKFEGGGGEVEEEASEAAVGDEEKAKGTEGGKEKVGIAAIGVGRKRKAGKVVGADDEEEGRATATSVSKKPKSSLENDKTTAATSKPQSTKGNTEKGSKSVKKGKKIKLSFGDDE